MKYEKNIPVKELIVYTNCMYYCAKLTWYT